MPFSRELCQSPQAIQKRNYRTVQREKRRRSFFIHDYVRTKYPRMFNEANGMYLKFVDKYPGRADLTKTYYFKKWQRETDKARTDLMIPHLPILMSPDNLQQTTQQPPEEVQQSPQDQTTVQNVVEDQTDVQDSGEDQATVQSIIEDQTGVQNSSEDQDGVQNIIEDQTGVQNIVEVQTGESEQLITGMTLSEMNLAVEEIVNALQSDRELMDIVEGFDLPDGVWNNELAVPDYILETDLQW